jgi:HSP20 family protein
MTTFKFANNGEALREAFVPKSFSTIVDSIFNEAVRNTGNPAPYRPAADIIENEKAYEIQVTLPGLTKEDISLELKENRLVLKGERKHSSETNEARYHVKESYHGSFSRSFRLPDAADKSSIGAEFKNGILNISISKLEDNATTIDIR